MTLERLVSELGGNIERSWSCRSLETLPEIAELALREAQLPERLTLDAVWEWLFTLPLPGWRTRSVSVPGAAIPLPAFE